MGKSSVIFFERKFPSANMILVKGCQPILIDTGFGSDIKKTEQLLRQEDVSPEKLHLIINTHYHSDHVGGNFHLQKNYNIPIAAHKWEADLINTCDVEACSAEWLDQPVEPYRVDRKLSDFEEIVMDGGVLQVLHTPGHTLGHISLYEPNQGILICGDLFHNNDIGWLNLFREGAGAIHRSIESLDRLAEVPLKKAYPGHGPQIDNPLAAVDAARKRLEKWLHNPEKVSWHACKRIFSFTLIIKNGLAKEEVNDYLLTCGWFQDFARHAFQIHPEDFIQVLLDEMIRSKAASWQGDRLMASVLYEAPEKEWMDKNMKPKDWKKQDLFI